MNIEEALNEVLKGNKIRNKIWKPYDKAYDILDNLSCLCEISRLSDFDWHVYDEPVDFATAWKAYEDGKTIKSVETDNKYNKFQEREVVYRMFRREEIRGKWEII